MLLVIVIELSRSSGVLQVLKSVTIFVLGITGKSSALSTWLALDFGSGFLEEGDRLIFNNLRLVAIFMSSPSLSSSSSSTSSLTTSPLL